MASPLARRLTAPAAQREERPQAPTGASRPAPHGRAPSVPFKSDRRRAAGVSGVLVWHPNWACAPRVPAEGGRGHAGCPYIRIRQQHRAAPRLLGVRGAPHWWSAGLSLSHHTPLPPRSPLSTALRLHAVLRWRTCAWRRSTAQTLYDGSTPCIALAAFAPAHRRDPTRLSGRRPVGPGAAAPRAWSLPIITCWSAPGICDPRSGAATVRVDTRASRCPVLSQEGAHACAAGPISRLRRH